MPRFTYPDLPLDAMARRAAARDPEGLALTTGRDTLTFAALDTAADRTARWLSRAVDRDATVGVANTLDAVFPSLYYGTSRAGRTIALVNPLLSEAALHHVFTAARISVAFVPTALAEVLTKLRDRLPHLRTIVVTDAPDGVVPADAVPLHLALDAVSDEPFGIGGGPADASAVVCVQFTTGTTGRPKGVRLTHRNLVANAAQIALAHRLGPDSVTLNHLPLFHTMHLNSAVYAGAAQILCRDPDPVASLALAARSCATHYYGLPARLHRLAADPRLPAPDGATPAAGSLRVVMSGGSALAPAAARRLSQALGVPVIQGYGMTELSPLTHNQRPGDRVAPGAVGRVLPGTECRIVGLDSGRVLGAGEAGEVQVRGPQLMAGYLGEDTPSRIDAEGWFRTGDVGRVDDDGVLHLVDRLDDVFKYDNELVSPAAVERVLTEDPRVAECVVADWPDPVHGGAVWAGIVLRDPPAAAGQPPHAVLDVLDAVAERANSRLAPFERIRRVEALDAVPRTPTGKPARRALRERLHAQAAAEAAA
ncbi:class I adenylate-forming enzyme family protein [Streptomyces sp. NPDC028635]|uniref:class I adenylate-forming enzyme family protein n=1 Tax=Streptomyces sp. NPDC028635 TaxID=3154800 RepID=UPI0033FE3617